eukprot:7800881-Ditylum_brightwellii.AAC.1
MIKQKTESSTEPIMFTLKAELVEFTEENEWKITLQQMYVLKESQDEPRTTTIQSCKGKNIESQNKNKIKEDKEEHLNLEPKVEPKIDQKNIEEKLPKLYENAKMD